MIVEYGIMSCKWQIKAEDKLTAYAAIIMSQRKNVNLIVIFNKELKEDNWAFSEDLENRLGEIYGGSFSNFTNYIEAHTEDIRKALLTIKKLI